MAPARAFQNLWPSRITFAIGAILTGLLSLGMQPWWVLANFSHYIFGWLGIYGALLGAFDGIAIADYWIVRKKRLDLAELYKPAGLYSYDGGINYRAVVAVVVGWLIALTGLWLTPLGFLWSGGWFFSLAGGLVAYALMMRNTRSAISEAQYGDITQTTETAR